MLEAELAIGKSRLCREMRRDASKKLYQSLNSPSRRRRAVSKKGRVTGTVWLYSDYDEIKWVLQFTPTSIGVPMFGYHTVLHAEHVESEGLMMLTVTPGPRLALVNDNHVVVANHIQQFALVIPRE